jgi:DNA-directed RNA polymerase II subunit RPB7
VEGTCNGKYGFILAVLQVVDTGRGLIREGSGSAVFNLKYKCICMKPFKGQVMDVVVTSVNKVGAHARYCMCMCGCGAMWQSRAVTN